MLVIPASTPAEESGFSIMKTGYFLKNVAGKPNLVAYHAPRDRGCSIPDQDII